MNLFCKNSQSDPFGILVAAANVARKSKFVFINEDKLDIVAAAVGKKLKSGLESAETSFWSAGNFEDDLRLVFFEDAVNFSFWNGAGMPQWRITYPEGVQANGGWYSLVAGFRRTIEEGIPVLDAEFVSKLTLDQCRKIFAGDGGVDIPMVEARQNNLNEAGKILLKNYSGRFLMLLEKADFDAVRIVRFLYEEFPSFRDEVVYKNEKILFLKRAQICASDINYVVEKYGERPIANLDGLTAFADYKLPQILRKFGAIGYADGLAQKIDGFVSIKSGSPEEVEIRAAAIWCVELIRHRLKIYTAAQIDNALWLMSQDQAGVKPFHRCRTIFY
ncbi:MAG: queuosine salvage family protein [Minisyncoccales bacterium]